MLCPLIDFHYTNASNKFRSSRHSSTHWRIMSCQYSISVKKQRLWLLKFIACDFTSLQEVPIKKQNLNWPWSYHIRINVCCWWDCGIEFSKTNRQTGGIRSHVPRTWISWTKNSSDKIVTFYQDCGDITAPHTDNIAVFEASSTNSK